MPNETEDYNNFVRANLPAGMTYSANRYRYNNHSFYVFELAAWYYYYLLRVNSPSNLFSANEVGVWYDPSDLTTLFQGIAGTTPVTAAGQPVGLMLDKSKGLALGAELVSNGDFSSGVTGWISVGVASVSVASGEAQVTNVTNYADRLEQNLAGSVSGKTYLISFDARVSSGTARISAAQNGGAFSTLAFREINNTTTQRMSLVASTTGGVGMNVRVVPYSGSAAQIVYVDNISVRELAGNHATQATSAQRPTYGIHPYSGVRNRVNGSADVGNTIYWPAATTENGVTATKIGSGIDTDGLPYVDVRYQGMSTGTSHNGVYPTANSRFPAASGQSATGSVIARVTAGSTANTSGLSVGVFEETAPFTFIGANSSASTTSSTDTTVSATRSISTGNQSRIIVSLTFTASASVDITYRIKGLQLELGSTRTAYQANFSQYNITEAGVPSVHYIAFDGVDDGMVTSAINFSATDAVTVFAGLRKLSDAAGGVVVELGASVGSSNGSFQIVAPRGAVASYGFRSRGTATVLADYDNAAVSAPNTAVLTGIGRIPSDVAQLRVNNTQLATSTSDQGTGNYANAILYIGRRAGADLPFNGNIYSLIVRGAESTANQITNTETWVNQKTGAY